MIGTFARTEGVGAVTPKSIRTTFKNGKLSGKKIAVADGMDADYAVVIARSSDEPGERGLSLALVDLSAKGVSRRAQDSIDPGRKLAELTFDNVEAQGLGKTGEGWTISNSVLDRAAILMAFEQVGGADTCLVQAKIMRCRAMRLAVRLVRFRRSNTSWPICM